MARKGDDGEFSATLLATVCSVTGMERMATEPREINAAGTVIGGGQGRAVGGAIVLT
jgi:hypothetical protein